MWWIVKMEWSKVSKGLARGWSRDFPAYVTLFDRSFPVEQPRRLNMNEDESVAG
jgi:hypothetical protein